ncbi:DUF3298 and DUF4163 domain-containing protein [Arenibacter latericius]|uniref:DUF3298 and DUF4163 domain-containing protein n=1 Tax=Arenibacter latericius TaxID=86104 RepID=UPI0003F66569|nr:DUF3298 and DUF4163 domain-containing protein [Arenibacter latericius]MDX1363702.1 DUF3298 and DUF4163 domain-containing protein [Arenibacter latericius]
MKNIFFCILVLSLVWSCKDEERLAFEPQEFTSDNCDGCPEVYISIPKALQKDTLSTTINTALREEVISMLIYDDEIEATTIEEAILSFNNGYLELKELYPDEPVGWEATIEGEITYEDENVLTIQLNSYSFTGGAHGFSSTRFLNFDKKKAIELENEDLFKDLQEFTDFAEKQFRQLEDIPENKNINYTGFMFEGDQFYLPYNIGYTQEGLKLIYEQYEVSSYADGPITLVLPYQKIKTYLKQKLDS